MHIVPVPYDSPASLFRVYRDSECDKDGYPFIWDVISELRRAERNRECEDCGLDYLTERIRRKGKLVRVALTVHHRNMRKEDCRRENLEVLCWSCHKTIHSDHRSFRSYFCRHCKGYFLGLAHLMRHIRGRHAKARLRSVARNLRRQRP